MGGDVNGSTQSEFSDRDVELLRRAITISLDSVANGNHPFGALLTDADGRIVLEAENTVNSGSDFTGHAETNVIRKAGALFSKDELRSHTLYTSCEPCAMCSGAIYWAGVGRVVYALSETELIVLTGSNDENPTMALPCRDVFAAGQSQVVVDGPTLQNEARIPHETFWG